MSWTVHRRIASREKVSDNRGQSGHPNLAEAPSVTAKKFYYDTVCYGSKAAFICALEAFGADHLVTGSDYPVLQDYEANKETFAYRNKLRRGHVPRSNPAASGSIPPRRR